MAPRRAAPPGLRQPARLKTPRWAGARAPARAVLQGARPPSLSYTLSYTLRNTRGIPIHVLQFYTLPLVLFLLKLVKYVNWQLSEAATIKALPQ